MRLGFNNLLPRLRTELEGPRILEMSTFDAALILELPMSLLRPEVSFSRAEAKCT